MVNFKSAGQKYSIHHKNGQVRRVQDFEEPLRTVVNFQGHTLLWNVNPHRKIFLAGFARKILSPLMTITVPMQLSNSKENTEDCSQGSSDLYVTFILHAA